MLDEKNCSTNNDYFNLLFFGHRAIGYDSRLFVFRARKRNPFVINFEFISTLYPYSFFNSRISLPFFFVLFKATMTCLRCRLLSYVFCSKSFNNRDSTEPMGLILNFFQHYPTLPGDELSYSLKLL